MSDLKLQFFTQFILNVNETLAKHIRDFLFGNNLRASSLKKKQKQKFERDYFNDFKFIRLMMMMRISGRRSNFLFPRI